MKKSILNPVKTLFTFLQKTDHWNHKVLHMGALNERNVYK